MSDSWAERALYNSGGLGLSSETRSFRNWTGTDTKTQHKGFQKILRAATGLKTVPKIRLSWLPWEVTCWCCIMYTIDLMTCWNAKKSRRHFHSQWWQQPHKTDTRQTDKIFTCMLAILPLMPLWWVVITVGMIMSEKLLYFSISSRSWKISRWLILNKTWCESWFLPVGV